MTGTKLFSWGFTVIGTMVSCLYYNDIVLLVLGIMAIIGGLVLLFLDVLAHKLKVLGGKG